MYKKQLVTEIQITWNAHGSNTLALSGDFELQCRVLNKPYDIFGTWYNDQYLLSGDLHWLAHLVRPHCCTLSSLVLMKKWSKNYISWLFHSSFLVIYLLRVLFFVSCYLFVENCTLCLALYCSKSYREIIYLLFLLFSCYLFVKHFFNCILPLCLPYSVIDGQ